MALLRARTKRVSYNVDKCFKRIFSKKTLKTKGLSLRQKRSFESDLNFLLVLALRKSGSDAKRRVKVDVSPDMEKIMRQKYGLNGRFKAAPHFHQDFQLISRRFVNDNDYCFFEPDQFKLKISKGRTVRFTTDNETFQAITSKPFLTVCFSVQRRVLIDEAQHLELFGF